MSYIQEWPEPIIRVQSLAESGASDIHERYVKPPSDRPELSMNSNRVNLPIIDLYGLEGDDQLRTTTLNQISMACQEWGFFQIVNHGVKPGLMRDALEVWRQFFHLPVEEKEVYANTPVTYEGYGSRLGVQKGAILDWNDYFFLHCLPQPMKDSKKWPTLPSSCSKVSEEYGLELVKVCRKLMKVLSINLGLDEEYFQNAFGREEVEACMRVNFYPKCPQPELTLGLSSHSDPGGITLLLSDPSVSGLQVRKGDIWVTVEPEPDALVVNIGDQIQVVSNAIYKSIEHRAIVNSVKERISIAFFCNPKSGLLLKPAEELVTFDQPALYSPMTFNEYRAHIRTRGPGGKLQMEAHISPP